MPDSPRERRRKYVDYLCGLENMLRSNDRRKAAAARRTLAHLRYSFVDGREYQAYEAVFQRGQPQDSEEAEIWLLVGGLFALHPLNWKAGNAPCSLGASLGRLRRKLESPAVDRRLTVLLAKNRHSLPHHLRQTVRLLSAHDVPVHYRQLLNDLVVLLGKYSHRGGRASAVRLRWAQEYYLPASAVTAETSDASDFPETTE